MAQTSLKSTCGEGPGPPARSRLAFGPFTLDISRGELLRDGQVVALRRKTFDLLVFLVSRPGEVLGKDRLIAAVWPGVVVTDDSLAQCVYELRTALGDAGSTLIHTVPRRGYRFDADVRPMATEPVPSPDAPDVAAAVAPAGPPAARATWRGRRPLVVAGLLILIAVIGLATLQWNRESTRPPAPLPPLSIVLLPLDSEAADGNSWFADALTAELTAELGRIASVFVISRDTAATYKGKPADAREVARSLGVRYVVRGTVWRSGEQVRLALAMVDGESGAQHWAQSFDIERSRLHGSLDDIAQQVARRLNVQMYRSGGTQAAALAPEQVHADDLAMQGWGIFFRGASRESVRSALPLFEQAVAKDPRSLLGWGGVAVMNGLGASTAWLPDRDAAVRRLEFASERLQELDAEHLYALLAKAHVANIKRDYEAYALVARMMIERYPNHAPSYQTLASALTNLGQFDECVELTQRAIRISPRDPNLGVFNWQIGTCHFLRGDYKQAAAHARLAGQQSPSLPLPPLLLAASLARDGQAEEARAIVAAYMQRHPGYRAADVAKIMRSENPVYAAGRGRLIDSLRELGMP
jgi:DNA-binding winged helix-turn-helix (wHTH) protein/TolB-like protein